MKIIYGGHWDNPPKGWISITEQEQDITNRLNLPDNSTDVIFNEHVWEHLPLEGAIAFAKESLRILGTGGILRIACPTIDKLIQFKNDDLGKHYSDTQSRHYYLKEEAALYRLGLDGLREDPMVFMFDSLLKGHNHKLIWSSTLIKKVLEKVGFSEVYVCEPGETNFNKEDCLERIVRGVDVDYLKEHFGLDKFDCETMVIEAKK